MPKNIKTNWLTAVVMVSKKMEQIETDIVSYGFVTNSTADSIIEEAKLYLPHIQSKFQINKIKLCNKLERIATYHMDRGISVHALTSVAFQMMGLKVPDYIFSRSKNLIWQSEKKILTTQYPTTKRYDVPRDN